MITNAFNLKHFVSNGIIELASLREDVKELVKRLFEQVCGKEPDFPSLVLTHTLNLLGE